VKNALDATSLVPKNVCEMKEPPTKKQGDTQQDNTEAARARLAGPFWSNLGGHKHPLWIKLLCGGSIDPDALQSAERVEFALREKRKSLTGLKTVSRMHLSLLYSPAELIGKLKQVESKLRLREQSLRTLLANQEQDMMVDDPFHALEFESALKRELKRVKAGRMETKSYRGTLLEAADGSHQRLAGAGAELDPNPVTPKARPSSIFQGLIKDLHSDLMGFGFEAKSKEICQAIENILHAFLPSDDPQSGALWLKPTKGSWRTVYKRLDR
jgi:hypothetical protein